MNEKIKNVSLKKLSVKLTQRIGISLLPKRSLNWKYKKEKKVLFSNENQITMDEEVEEEEDFDIPESIEQIIEFLLNQLRNSVNFQLKKFESYFFRTPLSDGVLQKVLAEL